MNAEKLKILLVEDDALSYLDIRTALLQEGYEVLTHPQKPIIDNYEDAIAVCAIGIPHIAVLDIDIKGSKDGIEIGQYIRDTFYSPVVFISSFNTEENLRRSGIMDAEGFVVKLGKPLHLDQLKTDLRRLRLRAEEADRIRREEGTFFVKTAGEGGDSDIGYRKTRIKWKELSFVRTIPHAKNYVAFYLSDGKKYIYHKNLTECNKELPRHFLRFSGHETINATLFTSKGKSDWVYYIDNTRYEVSEACRSEKTLAILKELFP